MPNGERAVCLLHLNDRHLFMLIYLCCLNIIHSFIANFFNIFLWKVIVFMNICIMLEMSILPAITQKRLLHLNQELSKLKRMESAQS